MSEATTRQWSASAAVLTAGASNNAAGSAPLLTSVGSNNTPVVDDRYDVDHGAQDRGFRTSTAHTAIRARRDNSPVQPMTAPMDQSLLAHGQRVSC